MSCSEKVQFSFVAPSIRPHLWKQFCASLRNTKLNWEVVFVGPKEPEEKFPSNVRHIKTNVKPSQCTHIGFLEAKGEIVSLTADDAQYFSPNRKSAVDNMYEFIKNFPSDINYDKDNIAYGFRMFEDKFCTETSLTHYLTKSNNFTAPLLYPFFAIHKETYMSIGGYDTGFICGQAENDFLIRIAVKYGATVNSLCSNAMVWADHEDHGNTGKFREYHAKENEYLRSLWINQENKYVIDRLKGLQQYKNDDSLLLVTQGEKGEWE